MWQLYRNLPPPRPTSGPLLEVYSSQPCQNAGLQAGSHCKAMNRLTIQKPRSSFLEVVLLSLIVTFFSASRLFAQQAAPTPRVLGTVQFINGKSLTVLSDAGVAATVSLEDATKLLQIEPGKTDLKEAMPLALSDLQPGDRVLVR